MDFSAKSFLIRLTGLVLLGTLLATRVATAAPEYPALMDSLDPVLQQGLQRKLQDLGLQEAAAKRRLAVGLADITDPAHPRVALINGNAMLYAASLPKIAILFGAFERIREGSMRLDAATREELTQMIRYSSNRAASAVLDRVGMDYLAELLQSPRYRLYDADLNGGLWVGKPYGRATALKRDPLHNLSHGATPLQVLRFYYLLETGRLVSPGFSREMKAILGRPGIHHKFVKGIEQIDPQAAIYRKSGTWRQWHADSAIIERDGRRYIAVALAQDPRGSHWLSRLVVAMDGLIFETRPMTVAFRD